jgi:isopentenyl diphosphate isomerase/L-lactate dehydrogenase-like FMN-dependent dehydrogenase
VDPSAVDGQLVVKGVLRAEDACRARDVGADAVIVSNHGGNALDSSPASLRMVPEVVKAVGGEIEVLMDGGVRRGSDVVKAIALGARAVLVGRAYVWALAAAGEEGVVHAVELLRQGIQRSLILLDCPSLAELDATYLHIPTSWS